MERREPWEGGCARRKVCDQVEGFALTMGKLMLSGHIDEVVDTIKANIRHV